MSGEVAPGLVAAALLRQGASIDALSRLITAAALLVLMLGYGPPLVLAAVAVAGVVELYCAIRVGFDAALFAAGDTDAALVDFGFLPSTKAGRPMRAKVAGAKRLLYYQAAALVIQIMLAVASTWISDSSPAPNQESQWFPKASPLAGPGQSPALC